MARSRPAAPPSASQRFLAGIAAGETTCVAETEPEAAAGEEKPDEAGDAAGVAEADDAPLEEGGGAMPELSDARVIPAEDAGAKGASSATGWTRRLESVSRFRRCSSARISDACW